MNDIVVKGSLTDITQQSCTTLAESFINVDAVVIVDTSGSMGLHDAPGSRPRYEAACDELRRLQGEFPGGIAVIAFSDTVQFCPAGIPLYLGAGTDMAKALRFAKMADGAGIKLILLSDGQPNDERETLAVAEQFTSRIDTVYIGPEGGPGSGFLQRLAQASGGISTRVDQVAMLAEPVKLLLKATG